MTLIEVSEYQAVEFDADAATAALLQQAAGAALDIRPYGVDRYRAKASSRIGSVVVGDLEIRITPKVSIRNVLFMLLSWDDKLLDQSTVLYGQSELSAAFAEVFAQTVTRFLRRGLSLDYREVSEDLDTIRGRIDVASQFRRAGQLVPIACRYGEYAVDTSPNRYLKHAVILMLRVPGLWQSTRRELRHALVRMEGVSSVPPPVDLPLRMRYTRLNRQYEPVLRMAHLVRIAVGFSHQQGNIRASTFLLDMNVVFQRYVEAELGTALRGKLSVREDTQHTLDQEGYVHIRPDLVFRAEEAVVYVGDSKYKLSASGVGRAADYYQLHAYCTRFGLKDGVLVYATGEEFQPPPSEVNTHGDGITLRTFQVVLQGTRQELRASIEQLADCIVARSSAVVGELVA